MNATRDYIGSVRLSFPDLPSTNQYAQYLASKTRPRHGTVIIADYQSHGQGQNGRSWYGSRGENIYLSTILFPRIRAKDLFCLNASFALALRDCAGFFVGGQSGHVRIKWPNDVYVNAHKVGGILIQNSLSGETVRWSIAGFGLNVNEGNFPPDLPNPTSLRLLNNQVHDLDHVKKKLLECSQERYEELNTKPKAHIMGEYLQNLLGRGARHTFETIKPATQFEAQIEEVDSSGRLVLRTDEGVKAYRHGEVSMLMNEMQDN